MLPCKQDPIFWSVFQLFEYPPHFTLVLFTRVFHVPADSTYYMGQIQLSVDYCIHQTPNSTLALAFRAFDKSSTFMSNSLRNKDFRLLTSHMLLVAIHISSFFLDTHLQPTGFFPFGCFDNSEVFFFIQGFYLLHHNFLPLVPFRAINFFLKYGRIPATNL